MPTGFSIICGASGTALSRIADGLVSGDREIQDVEEILKSQVRTDRGRVPVFDPVPDPITMGTISSTLNRSELLFSWRTALGRAIGNLGTTHKPNRAVACHLTLFNGETLEFFVAPSPQAFLIDPDLTPTRVILLIDDIYDMLDRLSEPNGLLEFEIVRDDYAHHVGKLAGKKPKPGASLYETLSQAEQELIATESVVDRLLLLLQWRRSEMIAAESLANSLEVPLTVLGVKHPYRALRQLVDEPETVRTVYVSHKITEARRHNRRFHSGKESTPWPGTFVTDVNDFLGSLVRDGVVPIQPTAIDELRFAEPIRSFTRRPGGLLDRWEIPKDSMFGEEAPADVNLGFAATKSQSAVARSTVLRRLEKSIYDEIAFRDHMLVAHNDHLVVFRPLVPDARLSSGVLREVDHWQSYWWKSDADRSETGFETDRRAFFVHVMDDLLNALNRVEQERRYLEEDLVKQLAKELRTDREKAARLVRGDFAASDHLGRTTGISRNRAEASREIASETVLTHSFLQWFCGLSFEPARAGVAVLAVDEPVDLRRPALAEQILSFLRGESSAEELNLDTYERLRAAAGHDTWFDFAGAIIRGARFPANPRAGWD